MGGMQVLEWGITYPERVRSLVAIATCAQATAQQIAWGAIGRRSIRLDPRWRRRRLLRRRAGRRSPRGPGHRPHGGAGDVPLRQRLHRPLRPRAGRGREHDEPGLWQRFEVERYLDHHGVKLVRRFDANSYLVIGKAMDLHDVGTGRGGLECGDGPHPGAHARAGHQQRHALPDLPAASDPPAPRPPRHADGAGGDRLAPRARRVPDQPGPGGRADRRLPRRGGQDAHDRPRTTDCRGARPAGHRRHHQRAIPRRAAPSARCCTPARSWQVDSLEEHRTMATAARAERFYGRYANPTVTAFEEAVAELEGAEAGLAFASGMGAVATVVMALCSSGRPHRRPAPHLLRHPAVPAGRVPPLRHRRDLRRRHGARARWPGAVGPGRTMLVLAETPANPQLALTDLDELGAIAGPVHRRRLHLRHARSSSARTTTASTSSCTRRPRASPATTTPPSASSPARPTCSTPCGRTRSCTVPAHRRSTP